MQVLVEVTFSGTVAVNIPDDVAVEHRQKLAESFALSRVIVMEDNPDAPDEDCVMDLADTLKIPEEEVGTMWDGSSVTGVGGSWGISK